MNTKNQVGSIARNHYKIFKRPCLLCSSISTIKHHENYDKPLDVIWLCRECHGDYHNNKLDNTYVRLIKNCYRWFYTDKWITYNWYIENKAIFPKSKTVKT